MAKIKRLEFDEGDLYHGDCIAVMKELRRKKVKVDLVFGSPPYEAQRSYDELEFDKTGMVWVDWMVEVFEAALPICNGMVALVCGPGTTDDFEWSATPVLLMAKLIKRGHCLRSPGWYYRHGIPGSGGPDDFRKDNEFIIRVTHGGKLPWSDNKAEGHKPKYKPGGKLSYRDKDGKRRQKIRGTSGYTEGKGRARYVSPKEGKLLDRAVTDIANPGDVCDCGAVGGGHLGSKIAHLNEAPFPEKLVRRYLRSFCPPGGTVLDPFAGSGSTIRVAVESGRRFIGIDARKSQIKLCERSIKEARKRKGFGLLK